MQIEEAKTTWILDNFCSNGAINLTANTVSSLVARKMRDREWPDDTIKIILGGCQITDEALGIIVRGNYQNIKFFSLWSNKVTHIGIRHLSQANWSNIAYMTLSHNKIGNKGCKYLTRMNTGNLISLRVGSGEVQDQGALHLSKGSWRNLQALDLTANIIGDKGVQTVIKILFPRLSQLDLNYNHYKQAGIIYPLLKQGIFEVGHKCKDEDYFTHRAFELYKKNSVHKNIIY